MLREVYINETNCITPIGFDVPTNIKNIGNEVSGIQWHNNNDLFQTPFYASIINDDELNLAFGKVSISNEYSRLEKMMILALEPIIKKTNFDLNHRTGFILSTTKGNVRALENLENIEAVYLNQLAKKIADFFEFTAEPIVVSNACVSGILAVSLAKRLIQANLYDNIFIVAGDEVSKFVLSGFNAFQAISNQPCKPYSVNRTGVTLGEAAAAVLVSSNKANAKIKIIGDGSINDANHISGPSRTGEGLFRSIQSALAEAKINSSQIDYISAHGTATSFNDEMEAIAFNRLGLENVPVNSFKGYYGHTLGASGLLEAIIGIQSVEEGKLFASLGFDTIGVSQPINVIEKNEDAVIRYFLKTASGFGGSNTAVLFEKV
ncbi:beta-ketoacyl synthase N-terminal-like domain-containing protein [Flavobacterium sp. 5]|uniref:beta-ketoacyl synthase N-terminal-like domain-containing protein n=1 Tax=Flavobacterium sp. 5 TaxID=2035199 RepID=UPI000C2B7DAF|nr:beta-ketoacyl synthase N-terminal-like domain-containing protein [Flavobacterium sp. 5]PKB15938.1 3-oxoacyl-[acyl-carrier-protein] synthase-1 [Flavobacterium sp. 5]